MPRPRFRTLYKDVEERIGGRRSRAHISTSRRSRRQHVEPMHDVSPMSAQRLSERPLFADAIWVRGVAWSILGGSGPLDSGSNPDGPIPSRVRKVRHYNLKLPVGLRALGLPLKSCR